MYVIQSMYYFILQSIPRSSRKFLKHHGVICIIFFSKSSFYILWITKYPSDQTVVGSEKNELASLDHRLIHNTSRYLY